MPPRVTRPDRHVLVRATASSQIPEEPDVFAPLADRIVEPPLPPERLLALYEDCAIHAACITAKATDAVGQGDMLVPLDPAAPGPANPDEQDALRDWCAAIAGELTFGQLLYHAVLEEQIFGWAAWEVVRDEQGQIGALYPIPGHTLRACREPDCFVQVRNQKTRYFVAFGSDRMIDFETGEPTADPDRRAAELILFRAYCPRSAYYTVPDWISAVPAIAELAAIREYNVSWFTSGGMTDRILTVTARTDSVARSIAEDIKRQLDESRGRSHVTVIVYGTEDVAVGVTNFAGPAGGRDGLRDREFRHGREDLVKEVLMAHRVPAYRVGWTDGTMVGGIAAKEILRTYRLGGVAPLQRLLEARLNRTLFGPRGYNLRGARWRLRDVDFDTMELNIEQVVKGISYGALTPSEASVLLGRPPAPPDDTARHSYFMSASLIPLATAVSAPPTAPGSVRPRPEEDALVDERDAAGVLDDRDVRPKERR